MDGQITGDVAGNPPTVTDNGGQPQSELLTFADVFDSAYSEETQPDEQKPDGEEIEEAEEVTEETSEKEENDNQQQTPKESKRTRNFKEVVAENTRLQKEMTRTKEFEKQFEEMGGIEPVKMAVDLYSAAIDPNRTEECLSILQSMPSYKKLEDHLWVSAISQPDNQLIGLNEVLDNKYGCKVKLTADQADIAFQWLALHAQEDQTVFERMKEDIELAETPDKKLAKLQAENERLKKGDSATETTPEDLTTFQKRIENQYLDFEKTTAEKLETNLLTDSNLNVLKTDSPDIAEAKKLLQSMIRDAIGRGMYATKAFQSVSQFWLNNQPTADNPHFKIATTNFENAMKAQYSKILKALRTVYSGQKVIIPQQQQTFNPNNPQSSIASGHSKKELTLDDVFR
jgi:hypothetical protein